MKIDISEIKLPGNLEFLAKRLVEGFITGLHKSPYHGFSVEFAEHKQYNFGESTKHIDWKVFAKTDRLYTRRYEEETNLRCHVLLDNSSSMHYPKDTKGKIKFASLAASSLLYLLHKQRDACGLITFTNQIDSFSQVKTSYSHLRSLFLEIENIIAQENSSKTTNLSSVIHEVAGRIHQRSLVLIFSDLITDKGSLEELFSALQHLKHRKHEVIIFHTYDRITELSFDFDDRLYEFVHLENNESLKLNPLEVKKFYQKEISAYFDELKLRCGQLKIDFVEADINEDVDQVLTAYMAKRARLR